MDVLGGFLLGARTTEVVLLGIRIKGRRPGSCGLKKVMMAIPISISDGWKSVNCAEQLTQKRASLGCQSRWVMGEKWENNIGEDFKRSCLLSSARGLGVNPPLRNTSPRVSKNNLFSFPLFRS